MNLVTEAERLKKRQEYNNEPVCYCKRCLSLKIMDVANSVFCDDCSSTEIAETSIEEWLKLYKEKYKKDFI